MPGLSEAVPKLLDRLEIPADPRGGQDTLAGLDRAAAAGSRSSGSSAAASTCTL
jgi:hypothetical protein